jgi:hypothetical protein
VTFSVQPRSLPQDHTIWISGEEKTNSLAPHSPKVRTSFGARPPVPSLMSPRTVKFVEAMIREGDSFDYNKWLKRVRAEEARAKPAEAASPSGELTAAQMPDPIKTSNDQPWPKPVLPLIPKKLLVPTAIRRPHHEARDATPKARLRRWLEKIRRAWDDFQASRARDAVYAYLEAVLTIVEHYRVRRRTNRLLRHAFKFANLSFDKNVDPFSAVIRCTSDRDIDSKTISKWARALRYVAHCNVPRKRLKTFMKELGGVNACADRYAKLMRRV